MKLLTTSGNYTPVSLRSGWPMAGLNSPRRWSDSWSSIELGQGAGGEPRRATYYGIYKSNPWVWACVNMRARGIARLPLHVFKLNADASRERVRGDLPGTVGRPSAGAGLDNLLRNPAPQTSRRRLLQRMLVDRGVYGNGLWSIDRDSGYLWHVPWRRVHVQEGESVEILYYEIDGALGHMGSASRPKLVPEDVVHFRMNDDSDTPLGISPIAPLRSTIALYESMQRHLVSFFNNQARLSGHLKVERSNNEQNLRKIRQMVTDLYTNPENAGKVLVSSGEWTNISSDPSHSSIIELIHESREEICAAYHMPPVLVGILDKAIKSNVQELREFYNRDTLGPDAEAVESDIMAQLVGPNPTLAYHFIEFNFAEAIRPDFVAESEALKTQRYVYGVDELRKARNLPPVGTPDAKVPMVPVNERPVGMKASEYGATNQPVADEEPPEPPAPADDDDDEDELDD